MDDIIIDLSGSKSSSLNDIEMLMNKKSTPKQSITDSFDLEDELNEITNKTVEFDMNQDDNISLSGLDNFVEENTGFLEGVNKDVQTSSFWNDLNPLKNVFTPTDKQPDAPSNQETLQEKIKYLKKLEELEKKGIELTQKYTMDSNLLEMQGEYETLMSEKQRQNSVKFQGNMLLTFINGIEFLNGKFDPFDIKLDGWSDQIGENIGDFDEIFEELHEKYKTKAKFAPELKLLFQLASSAIMVHMTNTMFSSSLPGVDDIFKQNPDLMNHFQSAVLNSMNDTKPKFSSFMSDTMKPKSYQEPTPPPPEPMKTSIRQSSVVDNDSFRSRGGNNNPSTTFKSSLLPTYEQPPPPQKTNELNDIFSRIKTKTMTTENQKSKETSMASSLDLSDIGTIDKKRSKRSSKKNVSDKNILSLDL